MRAGAVLAVSCLVLGLSACQKASPPVKVVEKAPPILDAQKLNEPPVAWVHDHEPGYKLLITQPLEIPGLTTRPQVLGYLHTLQQFMYPGDILILTKLTVKDRMSLAPTVQGHFGYATVLVYTSKTSPKPTFCAFSPATKPCQSKNNIKGV